MMYHLQLQPEPKLSWPCIQAITMFGFTDTSVGSLTPVLRWCNATESILILVQTEGVSEPALPHPMTLGISP